MKLIWFVSLFAAPLAAQVGTGDWVVLDSSSVHAIRGVYRVIPATGAATPIVLNNELRGLDLAPDNRNLILNRFSLFPAALLRMTPQGVTTTLVTYPSNTLGSGMALDQDGTWVVATNPGLLRVDPSTGTTTLLASTFGSLNDVTIDQDTGDYFAVHWIGMLAGQGTVFRFHRRTNAVTTITTALGFPNSIDFEPRTGQFIVPALPSFDITNPPSLRRISRNGVRTTIHATFPQVATAVVVDPETGNYLAGGRTDLGLVSPAGLVLTSHPMGIASESVALYGSAKITGSGPATPGSTYTYRLNFPDSPGRAYVCAMSFGLRPGIALADGTGRVINLDPTSPLFVVSLGGIPAITGGYTGVLDAQGNATATIAIQPGTPPDIRWHFSAVVLDPSAPSGIVTSNTWSFSTN
jgi:hypothetical protein